MDLADLVFRRGVASSEWKWNPLARFLRSIDPITPASVRTKKGSKAVKTSLDQYCINVTDLEKSVHFYETVLGFEVVNMSAPGLCTIAPGTM